MVTIFERIGLPELILILVVALIVFGPKKLPELGKSLGEGIREFKKATRAITEEVAEAAHETDSASPSTAKQD